MAHFKIFIFKKPNPKPDIALKRQFKTLNPLKTVHQSLLQISRVNTNDSILLCGRIRLTGSLPAFSSYVDPPNMLCRAEPKPRTSALSLTASLQLEFSLGHSPCPHTLPTKLRTSVLCIAHLLGGAFTIFVLFNTYEVYATDSSGGFQWMLLYVFEKNGQHWKVLKTGIIQENTAHTKGIFQSLTSNVLTQAYWTFLEFRWIKEACLIYYRSWGSIFALYWGIKNFQF